MKITASLLATLLSTICFAGDYGQNAAIGAAKWVRENLKKPESFEIVSATMIGESTMCLEYKARNSFNDVTRGYRVITNSVNSDQPKDWNKLCAKKNGTDYTSSVRYYVK